MKSNKAPRGTAKAYDSEDLLKKAVKLSPIKKSGKEKNFYIAAVEEEEDLEFELLQKRESVLDYFDDGEDED